MSSIVIIMRLTLREAARRKVLWGLLILGMLFLALRKLVFQIDILTSPIFIISVMAAMTGFQSILMGLIAELLVRTYHESQQKPTYTVRKVLRGGRTEAGK